MCRRSIIVVKQPTVKGTFADQGALRGACTVEMTSCGCVVQTGYLEGVCTMRTVHCMHVASQGCPVVLLSQSGEVHICRRLGVPSEVPRQL